MMMLKIKELFSLFIATVLFAAVSSCGGGSGEFRRERKGIHFVSQPGRGYCFYPFGAGGTGAKRI